MTVMVEGRYRLSSDGIVFGSDTDEATAKATPFKATTDSLVLTGRQGPRVKMARVGVAPDSHALLVGVWRYLHYTGATTFEKFTADGQYLFRLPFPDPDTGCFTVLDAAVTLSYSDGPPLLLRQTATDVLQQGEDEASFERAAGGAWYPLTGTRHH